MDDWALVLGNSSGSGAAICKALAREPGLHVFGVHRGNHPQGSAAVKEAVETAGRRYQERVAEAGKEESIAASVAAIREAVGPRALRIFVHLIANASLGKLVAGPQLLHPKQFLKTFESMAHSFVWWTRALLEAELLAPGARVLALTNAIKDSTLANCSAIAAAKAALEMYVKYMGTELGPLGYRVNALKFGTVETTALQWIFPDGQWEALRDVHHRMFPAGRMGTVEEVGAFVSVLAGEAGAWFNGAVIDFTGGQMNSVYDVLCKELAPGGAAAGGAAAGDVAAGIRKARQ